MRKILWLICTLLAMAGVILEMVTAVNGVPPTMILQYSTVMLLCLLLSKTGE